MQRLCFTAKMIIFRRETPHKKGVPVYIISQNTVKTMGLSNMKDKSNHLRLSGLTNHEFFNMSVEKTRDARDSQMNKIHKLGVETPRTLVVFNAAASRREIHNGSLRRVLRASEGMTMPVKDLQS